MKIKEAIVLVMFVMATVGSMAQQKEKRFDVELNGGVSFAIQDLGDAQLKTGGGFEGILHYRFLQHTGIYAGWGWNKFASDESFAGNSVDFEETGYVFGLQFKHPLGMSPVKYYLRAGGLYNHIEIENEEGDITEDTGHGLGWQLAGGFDIPLGSGWSLTPGVKFNALSRDLDMGGSTTNLDLKYFSVRVGISKSL